MSSVEYNILLTQINNEVSVLSKNMPVDTSIPGAPLHYTGSGTMAGSAQTGDPVVALANNINIPLEGPNLYKISYNFEATSPIQNLCTFLIGEFVGPTYYAQEVVDFSNDTYIRISGSFFYSTSAPETLPLNFTIFTTDGFTVVVNAWDVYVRLIN